MKKIFKKSLACLIAVLMIVSSLPFATLTANAAETVTVNVTNSNFYGALTNNSTNDRVTSNVITICNDGENDNFDIGFVTFNVSSLKGQNIKISNANYTYKLGLDNGREDCGLKFYYPTKNITDFHASSQQHKDNTKVWSGDNTISSPNAHNHIQNAIDYYGLKEIPNSEITTITGNTGTKTLDVSAALQWAILNNKNNAAVCFMLGKKGGINEAGTGNKGKGFWTDTKFTVTNTSLTVTKSDITSDVYESFIDPSDASVKLPSETYVNTASSNTDFMKGVVYAEGWTSNGTTQLKSSNNSSLYFQFGVNGLSNAVAIYTGSNDIRFPVIAYNRGNGRSNNTYIRSISLAANGFELGNDWYRCNGEQDLTFVSNDPQNFSKNYDGTHLTNNNFLTSDSKQWRNYIKYTGTGNTTNYYEKLPTLFNFRAQYGCDSSSNGGYDESKSLEFSHGMYVLNMKPYKDIVDSLKTDYFNVKNNSLLYTDSSLTAYYKAVFNIIYFDISSYVSSITGENSVETAANAIKTVVNNYNSAKVGLTKKVCTVTFKTVDNGTSTQNVTAGEKLGALPANTTPKHIENSDKTAKSQHTIYKWDGVTADTVITSNITVNEVASAQEDCTINQKDGTCTVCHGTALDLTAYKAAVDVAGEIMLNHKSEYTKESYDEFEKIVTGATAKKGDAKTQEDLDALTYTIQSAQTVLRKNSVTVILKKADANGNTTPITTYEKDYGTELEIDLATADPTIRNVEKWTVSTDNGATTTKLSTTDKKIAFYVTKSATVTVYELDEPTDSETVKYSKVVFLGKNGVVVDIKYVKQGDTKTPAELGVTVPTVPFYTSNGWDNESITGTGNTIYVRAKYTASTNKEDMCNVHFGEWSRKYSYDSFVRPDGIDPSKQYALASDAKGENILTYLEGVDFYAPKTSNIYVVEVSERVAKTGITGHFAGRDDTHRWATYNCKFYLPKDCTAIEWGLEVAVGKQKQLIKAEYLSKGNEYTVNARVKTNSTLHSVTCRSYVTYKQGNETKTIYSDVAVEQTF